MPPFLKFRDEQDALKSHLVSNFYDLPLKSWFFGQLEPIKRQLRIFEFGSLVYYN